MFGWHSPYTSPCVSGVPGRDWAGVKGVWPMLERPWANGPGAPRMGGMGPDRGPCHPWAGLWVELPILGREWAVSPRALPMGGKVQDEDIATHGQGSGADCPFFEPLGRPFLLYTSDAAAE